MTTRCALTPLPRRTGLCAAQARASRATELQQAFVGPRQVHGYGIRAMGITVQIESDRASADCIGDRPCAGRRARCPRCAAACRPGDAHGSVRKSLSHQSGSKISRGGWLLRQRTRKPRKSRILQEPRPATGQAKAQLEIPHGSDANRGHGRISARCGRSNGLLARAPVAEHSPRPQPSSRWTPSL